VDIRNKLGRALLELGELSEAETELRQALEEHPGFVAARVNLGLVQYRRGATEDAAREWQTALEHAPGNGQARAFLAMLGRPVPGAAAPPPTGG